MENNVHNIKFNDFSHSANASYDESFQSFLIFGKAIFSFSQLDGNSS